MCGIFGYIGSEDSAEICLEGLKKLGYRGYDSAGLAGLVDGLLHSCKRIGKVEALTAAWNEKPIRLDLAISHTRWATHGKPTELNAHPHLDQYGNVAVVHNGIIENHNQLRENLKEKGFTFQSDTDTEVIAQLVSYFYRGDLVKAVQETLSVVSGFWALAIIHKDHPDMIVAAAKETPLAIAHRKDHSESFFSSDPNAFPHDELDVVFLKSDELAVIKASRVEFFNGRQEAIVKDSEKLFLDSQVQSKGSFAHFMIKEIFDQPQAIQQSLHDRILEDFGTVEFENLSFTPQELQGVSRILILACGTSWHAGCIAASLLEEKARIPTQCEIASEFRYKNPLISEHTLVIAISQSGETLDTIAAVREVKRKGAKVLAICNARNSTLTREADSTLFLRAGPEVSVCSTKAFTTQITTLSLFTLLMGRLRHLSKEEGQAFIKELRILSQVVEQVLEKQKEIAIFAKKYASFEHFFFLGRHYMYVTALEAALKLKEISYLNAVGCPAGEMKHGPIALVSPDLAIVAFCGNRHTQDKTLSNLMEAHSRGAPIFAFAFENETEIEKITKDVIYLPHICDELASIPFSVAAQLFAYEVAKELGTDIDQPRNLAKSVTVE